MNFANEAKRRADQAAREQQLTAAAAAGEPEVTRFDVEKARRTYTAHLEQAQMIAQGRAGPARGEERRAAVRGAIEAAELDRVQYQHTNSRYQAQERRKLEAAQTALAQEQTTAAKVQARAANINVAVALFVGLAIVAQAVFAVKQYGLQKWQIDHPAAPVRPPPLPEGSIARRLFADEVAPLMNTHLDHELASLRSLASRVNSKATALGWRVAMQQRSTRVATLVRLLPRIVPGRSPVRVKTGAGWVVSVGDVTVLTLETRTPGRSVDDLAAPFVVRLLHPDPVDGALLEQLESEGLIRVAAAKTP
jgi:hypothetical protein